MILIRLKVWTSPEGDRYIGTVAFVQRGITKALMMRDMSEGGNRVVEFKDEEWDELPFSTFQEIESNVPSPGRFAPDVIAFDPPPPTVAEVREQMLEMAPDSHYPGLEAAIRALPDLTLLLKLPFVYREPVLRILRRCPDFDPL